MIRLGGEGPLPTSLTLNLAANQRENKGEKETRSLSIGIVNHTATLCPPIFFFRLLWFCKKAVYGFLFSGLHKLLSFGEIAVVLLLSSFFVLGRRSSRFC